MRHARPALVAAVLLVLALACLCDPGVARAQVSPGPLASPHADLDGTTQCFRCHQKDTGKVGMDRRCLDCHTEIALMRTHQRGYHARKSEQTCASCHPDHGGRSFALVAWDGGAPETLRPLRRPAGCSRASTRRSSVATATSRRCRSRPRCHCCA